MNFYVTLSVLFASACARVCVCVRVCIYLVYARFSLLQFLFAFYIS